MIEVNCSEMTVDEQIALASAISDGLEGRGVALVKDASIVVDPIAGSISQGEVLGLIRGFVSKRKEAKRYSVEAEGESIIVNTPDPLARSRGRKDTGQLLPPNLLKCPFSGCGFVTPYPEVMEVHVRTH